MLEFDVAIVGGGPVGGYIAGKIAEQNFRVALFERNKEIGMLLNCAGLVTSRMFDFLDLPREYFVILPKHASSFLRALRLGEKSSQAADLAGCDSYSN